MALPVVVVLVALVIAIAEAYEWATRRALGPDPGFDRRRFARPIPVHGCASCVFYSIGDDVLAAHLEQDHAA